MKPIPSSVRTKPVRVFESCDALAREVAQADRREKPVVYDEAIKLYAKHRGMKKRNGTNREPCLVITE